MPSVRSREPLEPALERLRRDGFGSEEVVLLERAAREMVRVDDLFRPYVGPALADRLELEPSMAELGGARRRCRSCSPISPASPRSRTGARR